MTMIPPLLFLLTGMKNKFVIRKLINHSISPQYPIGLSIVNFMLKFTEFTAVLPRKR